MKIYVVSHYYDNGESYEDYRDFEDHSYYSTFELANTLYWDKVTSDYEGKYILKSVVLNTQETNVLEESVYLTCHSQWDDYYNQENPEPDYGYCPGYPEDEDIPCTPYDSEEDELVEDYLYSEGTNFKTMKEIDDEIKARRQAMLMNDLNESLDDILTEYDIQHIEYV